MSLREGKQQLGKPGSKSSQTAVRAADPGQGSSHEWLPSRPGRALPARRAVFTSLGIGPRDLQHMTVLGSEQPACVEERLRKGLLTPSCLPSPLPACLPASRGGGSLSLCDSSMSYPGERRCSARVEGCCSPAASACHPGSFHLGFLESALLLVISLT